MSALNAHHLLVSQERVNRKAGDSLLECQPFLEQSSMNRLDRFVLQLNREAGEWENTLSREQTAFALAGITAASILPPLVDLDNGNAMLDYQVNLRDHLDSSLISELVCVLQSLGSEIHWTKIAATAYASAIGSGVAACIDVTPGHESLSLRYASALAEELFYAGRAATMPRSRLFLQTALYERVDSLLEQIRTRMWFWLNT